VWTQVYDDPNAPPGRRKQKRRTFRVGKIGRAGQREAAAEEARFLRQIGRGFRGDAGKMLFSEFAKEWETYRSQLKTQAGDPDDELAPQTHENEMRRLRNHVLPVLGKFRLDRIGVKEIEAAKAAWKQRPNKLDPTKTLGRTTVTHIYSLVRLMLNDAVRWKYLESNPCADVKTPRRVPGRIRATPVSDARRLLETESLEPIHVAALVALLTGARRGEVLALTAQDFDWDAGLVWFTKAVTFEVGSPPFVKGLKTKDKPREPVPLYFLGNVVQAYLAAHPGLVGPIFPSGGRMNNVGRYWHPNQFSKALRAHCRDLGIDATSAQRLRHAFNSIGAMTGADALLRSQMLGNSVAVNRKTYTTVYSQAAREAIRLLEAGLRINTSQAVENDDHNNHKGKNTVM